MRYGLIDNLKECDPEKNYEIARVFMLEAALELVNMQAQIAALNYRIGKARAALSDQIISTATLGHGIPI